MKGSVFMINQNEIIKVAKEERNAYARQWRKLNKEKIRQYNSNYWRKRAEKLLQERS